MYYRVCNVLQTIMKMSENLKYDDPTDQKLFDDIEKIRAKFKQVEYASYLLCADDDKTEECKYKFKSNR